ncbi:MAG: DUF1993 domain-containing protein [Hahellaceae bacterium]|nr:DUF1993 domain-containing protein [Hahellaceae bacterium]
MSMYSASLPSLIHMLGNLKKILQKAAAFAESRKINPEVLAAYRLAPDMLPLSSQIQIACDTAKGCGARLSGVEAPRFEDTEKNLVELQQRITNTLEFLKTLTPEQIDGTEDKFIELKFPSVTFQFKGVDYVNQFVLPNFYFHMTTAYGILRHCGVEIGKSDYLGGI